MITRLFCVLALGMLSVSPALAQFDSGSDGSDGAFNPTESVEIDLSLADGTPGNGTYDPDEWAVIFNYTTIDVPGGVTVTFHNHPSGAPVIWLASGDVTINGSIQLDGTRGQGGGSDVRTAAPGGPGGFYGGFGGAIPSTRYPSGGFGPGGPSIDPAGNANGSGGSHATSGGIGPGDVDLGPTYGNIFLLPLIGGSGGAGGWGYASCFASGGGGGGGAILVASSVTITLNNPGQIRAGGGNDGGASCAWPGGGGAAGGIRLIANQIAGTGFLRATGGANGGDGYIRVEANLIELSNPGNPAWTSGTPGLVFPPTDAPTLVATMVDTQPVPTDPVADVEAFDVTVDSVDPVTIQIEGAYIPIGTTVDVRVVPKRAGNSFVVTSTPLAGTLEASTATAEVTFPPGLSEAQLSATFAGEPQGRGPTSPGEKDQRYASAKHAKRAVPRYRRVHAIVGVETGPGPNEMTYLTGDGRRVTYPADLFSNAGRILQAAMSHAQMIGKAGKR